ncbi:MAG TPA: chromate transporter [Holophagaceae bacterium]|nr:chromate transporter [Holophagaceae bacterium]
MEGRPYTLRQLLAYFLRLGTLGFGGPVALVGAMERDLVQERGWISADEYKQGLTLAQLAPGPLAAQLGIYMGYVHHGAVGATLAGLAFILPSFLMVVAFGALYLHFGGLPVIQALFYGIGAAVIGLIARSAWKLGQRTLGSDPAAWTIAGLVMAATLLMQRELVWFFLGGGAALWFLRARPKPAAAAGLPLGLVGVFAAGHPDWPLLGRLGLFFAKAGAFVFGSGLAIVPFLYAGVVHEHRWLTERQFLDAVAVAMITPGPVVITVAFIGFLVAGLPGACVAALATFLPCWCFTVLPAPYLRRHGARPGVKVFVDGVTAAAVGAIAGAVVLLGRRILVDLPTVAMALATLLLLWRYKKLPEPLIIAGAGLLGFLLKTWI